jgi:hypothetical protein
MFPATLLGQEFSIEAIINKGHSISDEHWLETYNYCNSILRSKVEQLRSENKYRNQPISHQIPDSLAEKTFRLKKGNRVVQIYDNKIIGTDSISGFEAVFDPNGNIIFYLKLQNLENRHLDWYDVREFPKQNKYYFYVINAENVELTPLSFPEDSLNDSLLNKINDYFNKHKDSRSVLRALRFDLVPDPYILQLDSMRVKLKNFCELRLISFDINDDEKMDYVFEAHPKNWRKGNFWDFSFIISPSLSSPFFIPFSHFEFSVQVNKIEYLMFREYGPETGWRGRNLYLYNREKNEMEVSFSDWTWSD